MENQQNVTPSIQRILLEQKLAQWRNTLFAAIADAKVAVRFQDAKLPNADQMIEAAKQEAKRCEIAIETLQQMLNELPKSDEPIPAS
ncbi:MAG: hypothetical protein A2W25_15420 [candidate division Zixibacteria bacterium RBG_16_53_22]|nr:MAG: hypothetical protein A2W25_15420 [candidate division Zixibacteria bacterium RBG_16_53_22]